MKNLLCKFYWDYGRMGDVDGLFVTTEAHLNFIKEHKVELDFGEILGKFSEVTGELTIEDITIITDDQPFIEKFLQYDLETGYDPFTAYAIIDGKTVEYGVNAFIECPEDYYEDEFED